MKNKIAYVSLIVAIAALAIVLLRPTPIAGVEQPKKESAFERVMRTQTIRCAYAIGGEPRLMSDPNTGVKSGTNYEIIEAIGAALHLKIDWAEEVGYGVFPEHLRSGKEDVFCRTVWTSSARAHKTILTAPIQYTPLYVFVRDGDMRFDNNLEAVNDEKVTLAVIDGTTLEAVASTSFPKAKHSSVPSNSDVVQTVLDVASGKADAVIIDESYIIKYNAKNPDKKLRRVPSPAPVRIYGEPFAVAMGEWELREMMNTAISELQNNGTIDRIMSKYEPEYGTILRASDPYAPEKK